MLPVDNKYKTCIFSYGIHYTSKFKASQFTIESLYHLKLYVSLSFLKMAWIG